MKAGKLQSTISNQEQFAKIESPEMRRSTFDRSSGYKTTLNAGLLYPVFIDEALPGDTFSLTPSMFGRLATPLKPIMDNIQFDLHFFSVPNRLVWDNWQKFNGEQDDPGDSTNFLIPTITAGVAGHPEESIYDYLGLPTKVNGLEHSALPLRAYNLIYNEWYRDENLQDSRVVHKGDAADGPLEYELLRRNKRKDYFTSALPFAQKGQDVSIPLGTTAPVQGNGGSIFLNNGTDNLTLNTTIGNNTIYGGAGTINAQAKFGTIADTSFTGLEADLSQATAATINALREAFQVQRMYERDARGGTRYTEILRAHFGVISPDARLQRPEFLGGTTSQVNVTPIAQTSHSETGETPQGNLSGVGTFSVNGGGFTKSFTEHEIIIGLVSIRTDINYQQGMHKMWSRSTRFDFYWPSFANLGEQAILSKELYADGSANDEDVFGYQERYAEYRYKPSQITGKYRSNAAQSLDYWHLAQDFADRPLLSEDFVNENPAVGRVVAVPSEPHFLLDCHFNLKCTRPMPTYATPGLIDHF